MKRFCLILSLIIGLINISTANSKENAEENLTPNYWNCQNFAPIFTPIANPIYTLFAENDTICNDTVYQHLYCIQDELFSTENYELIDDWIKWNKETHKRHIGEIRFDNGNRQIYVRQNDKDYLLFDFDVKVGNVCHVYAGFDTIPNPKQSEFPNNIIDLVVTKVYEEVKSYLLDGVTPVQITNRVIDLAEINHLDDPKYKTTWIDGIGSIYGLYPIKIEELPDDNPYSTLLLCSWNEGNQLYQAPLERFAFICPTDCSPISVDCGGISILDTKIDEVSYKFNTNMPAYNVLGVPISEDYKGIVIQKGKKYIKL
jgi:hypothetical protein